MRYLVPAIGPLLLSAAPSLAANGTPGAAPEEPSSPPTIPQGQAIYTPVDELVDSLSFGALLRMSFDYSGDEIYQFDGLDSAGVRFQDAQLYASATIEDFDFHIMAKGAPDDNFSFPPVNDGSLDDFSVRDAWVRTEVAEGVRIYGGQFKCPLVASANVEYDSLLFIDRTRPGQLFSTAGAYQPGVAVTYDNDLFHAKIAVQNGADSIADEFGVVVRGEYKVNGGAGYREGAYASPDELQATLGVAYFADGSQVNDEDFGSSWAADLYSTLDTFSLHAEILGMDEELAAKALGNTSGEDGTPYTATLGWRFTERLEAAVRWQDLDNDVDTTLLGGGLNYYISGHDLKLQFNVTNYDENGSDGTLYQLGIAVAIGERP